MEAAVLAGTSTLAVRLFFEYTIHIPNMQVKTENRKPRAENRRAQAEGRNRNAETAKPAGGEKYEGRWEERVQAGVALPHGS
jgi:hypothetical protein